MAISVVTAYEDTVTPKWHSRESASRGVLQSKSHSGVKRKIISTNRRNDSDDVHPGIYLISSHPAIQPNHQLVAIGNVSRKEANYSHYHKPRLFTSRVDLTPESQLKVRHRYCTECKRLFQNASNLRHHLNSSTHRAKGVPCGGCGRQFISVAHLALHIETGFCPGGSNRHTLKQEVLAIDKNHIITEPGAERKKSTQYCATKDAWDGEAFECWLCYHRFRTLTSLNRHLGSAAHDERIYVCAEWTCRSSFPTLGALLQHFEGGSCGAMEIGGVRAVVDAISVQMVGSRSRKSLAGDIACRGCGGLFRSGPGLVAHLESGLCPSNRDRHSINHLAFVLDTDGLITEPVFINGNKPKGLVYGEMFMCSLCRRKFRTRFSLNQHLESAVHEQQMYVCAEICHRRFSTLSALWKHVEYGNCAVKDVKEVQEVLGGILAALSM